MGSGLISPTRPPVTSDYATCAGALMRSGLNWNCSAVRDRERWFVFTSRRSPPRSARMSVALGVRRLARSAAADRMAAIVRCVTPSLDQSRARSMRLSEARGVLGVGASSCEHLAVRVTCFTDEP